MKAQQIKELTEKATEQLIAALEQGHSETLTGYLKAIGRFHRYSLHNILLIALQKPNTSYLAGFRTWNQLGRFVKKGEKGIVTLAPMLRQNEKENEESAETKSAVAGFLSAYVFDITQTDGKELPAMGTVERDPKDSTARLQAFANAQGISLEYSNQIAPARGVSYGGRVVLLPAQTPAEEFSTLTHELAHELLHRGERRSATSKRIRETEAEARRR